MYEKRTKTACIYLVLNHLNILKVVLCTLFVHFEDLYLSVICVQRYNEKWKLPNIRQSIFAQGFRFNIHKDFGLTENELHTGGVLIVYMILRMLIFSDLRLVYIVVCI